MSAPSRRAGPPAPAASLLPQPLPPECAQLDFLIGDWDTRLTRYAADGRVLAELRGRWRAEHRLDGRLVVDEYSVLAPEGGLLAGYVTLRSWCPERRRWEMTFLAAHQPFGLRSFVGEEKEGELHLEAAGLDAAGRESLSRVRFFDIERERFRWEQHASFDGGATWGCAARMEARRRSA